MCAMMWNDFLFAFSRSAVRQQAEVFRTAFWRLCSQIQIRVHHQPKSSTNGEAGCQNYQEPTGKTGSPCLQSHDSFFGYGAVQPLHCDTIVWWFRTTVPIFLLTEITCHFWILIFQIGSLCILTAFTVFYWIYWILLWSDWNPTLTPSTLLMSSLHWRLVSWPFPVVNYLQSKLP